LYIESERKPECLITTGINTSSSSLTSSLETPENPNTFLSFPFFPSFSS
jgi:Domain of unknown function (DUF4110)